jgi:L-fucose isomerase-like protein
MEPTKIGLVGFYSLNFSANQFGVLPRAVAALDALASSLDFSFHAVSQGVTTLEAAESARRELEAWGADLVLIQCSSFALGDLLDPFMTSASRIAIWAVPEPTREGPLPLNSLAAFNLYASKLRLSYPHVPFKWFYGTGEEPEFRKRFALTVRALATLKALRGANIGLLGGIAPTFDNLRFDHSIVQAKLGVNIVEETMDEMFARARGCPSDRVERAADEILDAVRANDLPRGFIETTARIYLALADLAHEHNYGAMAVSCWPRFQQELQIAPCAAYGWLNQVGLTIADEGDALGAVSMLALRAASGLPTTLMDMVALDEEQNRVQFWHCGGPTPPAFADREGAKLTFHPTLDRGQPAGAPRRGASLDLLMRPGPATIMRFSNSAQQMFLLGADILEEPTRGFEGSRGWFGNLKMSGVPVQVLDLLETIVYYGIEHHYPIAFAEVTDVMNELAAWAGLPVIPVTHYQAYLRHSLQNGGAN